MTRICVQGVAGRSGLLLLLLSLLFSPLAVQAQSASLSVASVGTKTIGATVSFTARASTVSYDWGDGSSSSTGPDEDDRSAYLAHTYENCGVKTISATVTFHGGGSASASTDFTVGCPPAQPVEGGPFHCGIYGCRQVPDYFIDNQIALARWLEDTGRRRQQGDFSRRPLTDFGYRCPDALGNCGSESTWIPGPARNTGLSNPGSYVGSPVVNRAGGNVQRINADGIGVKSIVDQNPIDAVDVWGPGAEGGGEVCFAGTEGRLIYLDARTSPRAQSELPTFVRGNTICGTMPGPGSVVYLPPAE